MTTATPTDAGPFVGTDYYERLDVSPTATTDEITKAYRKLAIRAHPDRGGSDDGFRALNRAYEVLKDEKKRAFYDRCGGVDVHDDEGSGNSPEDVAAELGTQVNRALGVAVARTALTALVVVAMRRRWLRGASIAVCGCCAVYGVVAGDARVERVGVRVVAVPLAAWLAAFLRATALFETAVTAVALGVAEVPPSSADDENSASSSSKGGDASRNNTTRRQLFPNPRAWSTKLRVGLVAAAAVIRWLFGSRLMVYVKLIGALLALLVVSFVFFQLAGQIANEIVKHKMDAYGKHVRAALDAHRREIARLRRETGHPHDVGAASSSRSSSPFADGQRNATSSGASSSSRGGKHHHRKHA